MSEHPYDWVIVTHDRSDFDALGSQVGAALLYDRSAILVAGKLAGPVREFFVLHQDTLGVPFLTEPPEVVCRAVVVDTQSIDSLGKWREWFLGQSWSEIHLYDHHPRHSERISASLEIIEQRGGTISLLLDRIRARGLSVTREQATLFAIALYTDTGNFIFPQTHSQDMEHLAFLFSLGVDRDLIRRYSAPQISRLQQDTLETFLKSVRAYRLRDRRVLFAHAELDERDSPDLSIIASKIQELLQPDILFLLCEFPNSLLVIGRSSVRSLSLASIWEALGGGGHSSAGSARLKNGNADLVRLRILEMLDDMLPQPLAAWDIMSFPVRGISGSATIKDAHDAMIRYGHSGLVVYEGEKALAGILTRKDTDRALRHRLERQKVRQWMSHPVITVSADASLEEIRETLVRHNIGRVPVVSDSGEVIGIVTRNDLIRASFERKPDKVGIEMPDDPLSRVPRNILARLTLIGQTAQSLGFSAYLVGGSVRDLLIGLPVKDYDIVIEGDASLLARKLSLECPCTIQWYSQFLTATAVFPEGLRIDLADAREEYYPAPGELPVVERASIVADLRRRDFTVNGIAISLNPATSGRILDPYEGISDLFSRRLRVFHTLSFVEDPTRIMRAVRYKHRLGFTLEEHTEKLFRSAISGRLLRKVSGDRIRTELERTFEEPNSGQMLIDMDECGIFDSIYRGWHLETSLFHPENQVLSVVSRFPEAPRHSLYFLALVHRVHPTTVIRVFKRLQVPRAELKAGELMKERDMILSKLRTVSTPSQIHSLLSRLPLEFLFYLYLVASPQKAGIELYLRELRHFRLKVTGEDLIKRGAVPGPRLGSALKRTLALRLDGKIAESEELDTALRLYFSNIKSSRSPSQSRD